MAFIGDYLQKVGLVSFRIQTRLKMAYMAYKGHIVVRATKKGGGGNLIRKEENGTGRIVFAVNTNLLSKR